MPPILFKIKFYAPGNGMKNAAHARYIATRPGADKGDLEIGDNDPDVFNLATAAGHVKYASERPGSHGLFSSSNEVPDLREIQEELKKHEGVVWRSIISLREDDAVRLSYVDRASWETTLRSCVPEMAEKMGIPESNLRWVAAYHAEAGHPHVHLVFWESNMKRTRGVVSDGERIDIRKVVVSHVFAAERTRLMAEKSVLRDAIRDLALTENEKIEDIIRDIRMARLDVRSLDGSPGGVPPRLYDDDLIELVNRLESISTLMPGKGRIALKYMPDEVKKKVLETSEWILKKPGFALSVDRYMGIAKELAGCYTTIDIDINKAAENAFKDIRERVAQVILKSSSQLADVIERQYERDFEIVENQNKVNSSSVIKRSIKGKENTVELIERTWNTAGKMAGRTIYYMDRERNRNFEPATEKIKNEMANKLYELEKLIPEDVIGRPALAVLPDDVKNLSREIAGQILQNNGAGNRYLEFLVEKQGIEVADQKFDSLKNKVAELVAASALKLRPQEIPEFEMRTHQGRVNEALESLKRASGDYIQGNKEEIAWTTKTMYRVLTGLGEDDSVVRDVTINWAKTAGASGLEIEKLLSKERDLSKPKKIEEGKRTSIIIGREGWERLRDNLGLEEESLLNPWFAIKRVSKDNKYQTPELDRDKIDFIIKSFELAPGKPLDYKEMNWTLRSMAQTLYALDVSEEDRARIVSDWVQRANVDISVPRLRDILDRTEVVGNKEYFMGWVNWERLNINLGIGDPSDTPWRLEGVSKPMSPEELIEKTWETAGRTVSRAIYNTDHGVNKNFVPATKELIHKMATELRELERIIPEDVIGRPALAVLPDEAKNHSREIADQILQNNGAGNRYQQLLVENQGLEIADKEFGVLKNRVAEYVAANALKLRPQEMPKVEIRPHQGRVNEALESLKGASGDYIRGNEEEVAWTTRVMYRALTRLGQDDSAAKDIAVSWAKTAGLKENILNREIKKEQDLITATRARSLRNETPLPVSIGREDWERLRDNLGLEEEKLLNPWFGIKKDAPDEGIERQAENKPAPVIIPERIESIIKSFELASGKPLDYKEMNWTLRSMTNTLYALNVSEEDRARIVSDWVQRANVDISVPRLRDILDRTEVAGNKEYFMGPVNWKRLNGNLGIENAPSAPWKYDSRSSFNLANNVWKSAWRALEQERSKVEAKRMALKRNDELRRKAIENAKNEYNKRKKYR